MRQPLRLPLCVSGKEQSKGDRPPNAAKQAEFRGIGLANPYAVSEVPPNLPAPDSTGTPDCAHVRA
jgi:hypothetical protein